MISNLTNSKLGGRLYLPELAFLTYARNDTTQALRVMARNGSWLNNAAPALLDSPEVILKAMPTFPIAFSMASTRLRDDMDFVVEALSINPLVAKYASQRLQAIILEYENREVFTSIRGVITIGESTHAESALRIFKNGNWNLGRSL